MDDEEEPERGPNQLRSGSSTWSLLVSALFYSTDRPDVGSQASWIGDNLGANRARLDLIDGQPLEPWSAGIGEPAEALHPNWANIILALVLVMLMLTTAIGNLFVIVAILIERNLRTIGNYLVLSLAIADLLVALLVMPLAGIQQILERWTLGVLLCDIWTSADVFCCTGKCARESNFNWHESS